MAELQHPGGKKEYRLCLCISFDCKEANWEDNGGNIRKGKWFHRNTVKKHYAKDHEQRPGVVTAPTDTHPNTSGRARSAPKVQATNVPVTDNGRNGSDSPAVATEQPTLLKSENEIEDTPHQIYRRLVLVACILATWLHLIGGLSRDASHKVLKVLGLIIRTAAAGTATSQAPTIPGDIRTAVNRLSIEPLINRSICCPKCFRRYSLDELPEVCLRRETSRSKQCLTPLWIERQTRGGLKRVPRRLYSTQDFPSWLSHFLSRPGMEDLIEKSRLHSPNLERMTSIWDSPAWQSLGSFTSQPRNLVFSYYIDWFNPFTNKIAGKHVSCGAIMAFCLNLPHHLQHLPENTYFAGITPPPKEPTVTTITALSDPVVDQLQAMWDGQKIITHNHPEGEIFRVAALAAIGDILALKKALGFAGHGSHNFCSLCKLLRAQIDRTDWRNFHSRSGAEILLWSRKWLLAPTKKERNRIFKLHGCRWSALNRLTYRDPVKHTVVGLMHNWLEGVLQHHARLKWGVGADVVPGQRCSNLEVNEQEGSSSDSDSDVEMMDVDEDTLEAELADLHRDSSQRQDKPEKGKRTKSKQMTSAVPDNDTDSDDEDDDEYDDDSEEEIYTKEKPRFKTFDAAAMAAIHCGLADVVIPSWIERPPTNLGEKSHGKLKADNWLVLFSIFFPLIIPELWHQQSTDSDDFGAPSEAQKPHDLLENFHDLVSATNIVCSYVVIPSEADTYQDHYVRYLESSKRLFPGLTTRPNHHLALHNGTQMKWWGPLPRLAEFMYESHNGRLQKIKTNSHMWELDLTMLRQICRRGRLLASIRDGSDLFDAKSFVGSVLRILSPSDPTPLAADASSVQLTEVQEIDHNRRGVKLPSDISGLILSYWNQNASPPFILGSELTFELMEMQVRVFPSYAIPVFHLQHKTRTFSIFDKHHGNSSISFLHPTTGHKDAGFIKSMWKLALQGQIHTFIVVQPHTALDNEDYRKTPYASRPGFACTIAYSKPRQSWPQLVIEPRHLLSHLAYYPRPKLTFGILKEIMIFVDSLHRNRE